MASSDDVNVRQVMKPFCLLLMLALVPVVAKADDGSRALAVAIRQVLPKNDWSVRESADEIIVSGPKVKTLFMVSLPALPESKLWREYSSTERVEVRIAFQARILQKDLAELRDLRDRLAIIVRPGNREINNLGKDGDAHIREFGFIRLPDYRSDTTSIFVQDNVGGRNGLGGWPVNVRPHEARDIVMKIYQVLETQFQTVDQAYPEEKKEANHSPEPALRAVH